MAEVGTCQGATLESLLHDYWGTKLAARLLKKYRDVDEAVSTEARAQTLIERSSRHESIQAELDAQLTA